MKYLIVTFLLAFVIAFTQTNQAVCQSSEVDCIGEFLMDSLVNMAGILPTLCFDTVSYPSFDSLIHNFNHKADTSGLFPKGIYLFSDFQISHDRLARQHIEIDNMYLTLFHDQGFELISHLMVVWDICDDKTVQFNTILDHSVNVGIGYAAFREIHRVGTGEYLIVGVTEGGDGGDTWGSLWFATWKKPRQFRLIYRESYATSMTEDGSDKGKSIRYSLDIAKMTAEITLVEETQNGTEKNTVPIYTKRISLREKL